MRCLSPWMLDPVHVVGAVFVILLLLVLAFFAGAEWGAPEFES